MNRFLDFSMGAIMGAAVVCIAVSLLPHTDNPCLQQQAGYQVALTSQTRLLTTQVDLLAKEKARAGLLQAAHTALQEEFSVMLASRVGKIDDVMEGPEAIAVLAQRLAPVEKAVKKVAEVEGRWADIPWVKELRNGAKLAGGRWK